MSFDDLIWKIWEIEEEIRDKQQEEEGLKRNLRELKNHEAGTLIKSSSSRVAHAHGINSYYLRFQSDEFEFQANDFKKHPVMRVHWKKQNGERSIESIPPNITIAIEKEKQHQKLEIQCDSSKSDVLLNGTRLSFADLENPETATLMYEYNIYFQDFLVNLTKDMQQQMIKGSGGNGGEDSSKKAIDIISDISCVCASFGWLGLAICGPTCLGMVIAKAVDP